MKKLIIISLLIFFLTSCEKICPEVPDPPYGKPDNISWYHDGGYASVTYTYYCYNGKYRAITWTREFKCASWFKSVYISNCIKK